MNDALSLKSSWDLLALLAAALSFAAAMYQFVVGQHYMIPTAILLWTVLFGNLARWGLKGQRWAKYVLFWFGVLMTAMAFMGLFFAQQPKVLLGNLFLPVWGALFLVVLWLTWQYKRQNRLAL